MIGHYEIKFVLDGELRTNRFAATSAGQAFERCLEKHPKARLIEATREGCYFDGYGRTTYQPPSLVRVDAGPAPKSEQLKLAL